MTLEADAAAITAKLLQQPEPYTTEEKLTGALAAYAENNADGSPTAVLTAPALAEVEEFAVAVTADTTLDSLLSKARVYLGQPRNYGPTDEEIAAKKALEDKAAAEAAADEARAAAELAAADEAEHKRRAEHEARRAAEVQQQDRKSVV